MIRILALAALAALSGCASGGGPAPGQDFSLDMSARTRLPDDSILHYATIARDSRCPPKVTCIRAGDVDLIFNLIPDGGHGKARRVVLNSERAREADMGAWRLQLRGLEDGPAPRATLRLEAK